MKSWLMLSLAALTLSACGGVGSFCAVYRPVTLNEEAARSMVSLDRAAAETLVANNATYGRCHF